ncbi:MAG: hypothetical protein IKT56_04600 [Clostridia bacterium]|nr:hypothetical protein [Clostridia bacterium]
MDKIKIFRQYKKPVRSERVVIWVSKDVKDALATASDETGLSQQCLADLLLRKAMEAIEVVEDESLLQ